jgi:hypothetical protein
MLLHAWRAEIIAPTAHRNDQCIITKRTWRRDLATFIVDTGGKGNLLLVTVEAHHLANAVAEMMPVRLREIVDGMVADIHAAGRYLMQKGFPDMGPGALDQRHLGFPAPAEPVPKLGHKLQSRRSSTDNDDVVKERLGRGR